MIRDIEELTGRRLVVYFGNRFENAQIDGRDCAFMAELLGDVGADQLISFSKQMAAAPTLQKAS